AGRSLTLEGTDGDDTFRLKTPVGTLASIGSPVMINGGSGMDSVIVDDSTDTVGRTYTVSNSFVGRGAGALLFYDEAEKVTLNATKGGDIVSVTSTNQGTNYFLNGGDGSDAFFVASDLTTVGSARFGLAGPVTIDAGAGSNTLSVQ